MADLRLLGRFLAHARARKAARLRSLRAELDAVEADLAIVSAAGRAGAAALEEGGGAGPRALLPAPAAAASPTDSSADEPAPGKVPAGGSADARRASPARSTAAGAAADAVPRGARATPVDDAPSASVETAIVLSPSGGLTAARRGTLALPTAIDPATARATKRRVVAQFSDLQECYLSLRCEGGGGSDAGAAADARPPAGLQEFSRLLSVFVHCSDLELIASVAPPRGDRGAAILSSLDFDAGGARFASAGVARRVAVYDCDAVIDAAQSGEEAPAPVVELDARAKLSCAVWAPAAGGAPHTLLATDYDGCATLWDVATARPITEFDAHDRRVWCADWSPAGGGVFATASDDGTAKLWAASARAPSLTLAVGANVCCVAFDPAAGGTQVAVGAADHAVRVYDIRSPATPLSVLAGHRKAVSYVRHSAAGLVSASTDSTLRLWGGAPRGGAAAPHPARVFRGHANERHFVGLAASGDLLACGSESNEVVVYHASMARPVARRAVAPAAGAPPPPRADGAPPPFVSAVCWRPGTGTLLAANSQGVVQVLALGAKKGGGGGGDDD